MLSFDEFLITFFTAGSDQTLPLYIFGRLRRTVDPGINVASTLLLAITMLLWVVAAIATLRAARSDRAAREMGVEL
jgi:ABC-type spermidine/putrescine transport system permease subunit II